MAGDTQQFLSVTLGKQLCGIPVLQVRDVIRGLPPLTSVPHAPEGVMGVMNLRGRIAAVISLRPRLDLPAQQMAGDGMSVVVENKGELYCLAVDAIGAVLSTDSALEPAPATLDTVWQKALTGVCRLDEGLLAVLDIPGMIEDICRNNEEEMPVEG